MQVFLGGCFCTGHAASEVSYLLTYLLQLAKFHERDRETERERERVACFLLLLFSSCNGSPHPPQQHKYAHELAQHTSGVSITH